ncbi:heparinase II/III domain-containing protein [Erysipelothrix larvae]|nr:heparinase II/III family protein [Erysipelothrix larvae]
MMKLIPFSEILFERKAKAKVKRLDLFKFNVPAISKFLDSITLSSQNEIINIADKAIEGVIYGFSSSDLAFGNPINWHLNPLTGYENRRDVKWYQIPDFDKKVGDIKVIWEASRFTHFLYFARAYILTKNDKYYEAFSSQLDSWLRDNPYSYGSNYKCGQEATLRMTNVLIVYAIFNEFNLISVRDKENIANLVENSYKKVLSNFFYAHKCIKNNHTFTEIFGLIVGSWCCENYSKLKSSYKLMDKEIVNQFLKDGGFSQYSFNYHRFTLQILEVLLKVSNTTGIQIKEVDRIKKSVLLLYQVTNIKGDVPNYGSNDGALIFPLSSCKYRDFRPVLNTVYSQISGKRLFEKGEYDEELLWFGDTLDLPVDINEYKSIAYDDIGIYVLRSKQSYLMTCLQDYKSRPAHMDQLHIDLWHKDINVLCDCGTYSYASDLSNTLSSTISHNTVKIPGVEQMNKKGTFLVTDWSQRENVFFCDSKFQGKMVSKNGYKHERIIEINENGYFVEDWITGTTGTCDIIFNTPCDVEINEDGFDLIIDGQLIVSIKIQGTISIEESYRSLHYLKKEKINKVLVSKKITKKICNSKFSIILH